MLFLKRMFPSDDSRPNSSPARLALVSSLLLIVLVLLLTWTRYSDNETWRRLDELRIRNSIESALLHLVLSTPGKPDVQSTQTRQSPDALTETINNTVGTIVYDFASRRIGFASSSITQSASALAPELIIANLEPQLAVIRETLEAQLRGSLTDSPAAGEEWVMRRDRSVRGFFNFEGKSIAFAAIPAQHRNHNSTFSQKAIVRVTMDTLAFASQVNQNAQTGHVIIAGEPNAGSGYQHFAMGAGGAPVYVSWRPYQPGDSKAAKLAALLSTFAALYIGFIAFHMTRRLADSEVRANRLAAEDLLTSLPNRMLFAHFITDEIERSLRHNRGLALLYLDFDRFKEVNDSFSHDGGDQLIIAAARRISGQLRTGDKLGRFGGDEFGVLQLDASDPAAPQALAERIRKVMNEPFEINGQSVYVGISIGIAMCPDNSTDRNELMRLADIALYRAKNNGRNCHVFYDENMSMELQKRKAIEDELRMALANDELDVVYQPIVAQGSHKLIGVEALARWPHEKRGLISPEHFIAIAEERGLIIPLGEWVLRRACKDALHWPSIRLSVNVSAAQFRHVDFVASVRKVLKDTGFDPARLELELTESVVIHDADQAEQAMIELRAMGIRIALDDFGTGYSSLIYLRRFALDKIKIDRSFLQAMEMSNESEEIVGNIVDLGRRLGLTVTAEGVETLEQLAFLEKVGCHELQGYLFGRPQSRLTIPTLFGRDLIAAAASAEREKIALPMSA